MSESTKLNNDQISAAFFPVELRDVFVPMPDKVVRQPRFHAVVDVKRSHVFAVVGDDYKLVTNEEAVALGRECFSQVFQLTDIQKMQGFRATMPKTRSFCHLDFVHADRTLHPLGTGSDFWKPYLRITNSYNRTYALNFELGFYRWICKNGLMMGKQSIDFKFTHSKRVNDYKISFRLRAGDFAALEAQFMANVVNLQRYHVPRQFMWPLFYKAFDFAIPNDLSRVEKDRESVFARRKASVAALTSKYFGELGENGYAAINVLTDYATRPEAEKFKEGRVNGFQRLCGEWMSNFVTQIEDRSFQFKDYLGEYYKLAV